MADWNPSLYLKFGDERTQPARDLLHRVELERPGRVLDVGCGPGNSTMLLARRWPDAEVIGLDSSASMLEQARNEHPHLRWIEGDAGQDMPELGTFDVVFSNAALQWIPDHDAMIPRLFGMLKPGGVLAVQIPQNFESPMHNAVRDAAKAAAWRTHIKPGVTQIYEPMQAYYDRLARLTDDARLWHTTYYHILDSHEHLIDWSRATYMRTYLNQLDTDALKKEFEQDVLALARTAYPVQPTGKIIFPFKRFFFIAGKPA